MYYYAPQCNFLLYSAVNFIQGVHGAVQPVVIWPSHLSIKQWLVFPPSPLSSSISSPLSSPLFCPLSSCISSSKTSPLTSPLSSSISPSVPPPHPHLYPPLYPPYLPPASILPSVASNRSDPAKGIQATHLASKPTLLGTALHCTVLYSAVQCSTVQLCSTVHSTVLCSTVQCSCASVQLSQRLPPRRLFVCPVARQVNPATAQH